jgi:poly(A) polymerase
LTAPPDDPLQLARALLAGQRAWLVGGAIRDRLRGQPAVDLDIVVDADPAPLSRALARAFSTPRATAFPLSTDYGGWRIVAHDHSWQLDLERLRGSSLADDLALRDFTINAIALPLDAAMLGDGAQDTGARVAAVGGMAAFRLPEGGRRPLDPASLIDPLGGLADLQQRRLRAASPRAFADDPLRVLRLVRLAAELDLQPTVETIDAARAAAPALRTVAPERSFFELRRIVSCARAIPGLELLSAIGATAALLPELDALRGVEQSRHHHLDVHDHTFAVLSQTIALTADPAAALGGEHAAALTALLAEPLADELTRAGALRWGALLHDIAKPATYALVADPLVARDRHVTFLDHDRLGATLAQDILTRLRASTRLRTHVAALVRHHLRLGFLIGEPAPLPRRRVFAYLHACEPVALDVTLLSVADRLATRGPRVEQHTIDAHLRVAREMLGPALDWQAHGPPPAPIRGDDLARALGIAPGPRLGALLDELSCARFAGEIATPEEALARARSLLAGDGLTGSPCR